MNKNILFLILFNLFFVPFSKGQSMPSDSLLLQLIYKKVDKGGGSTTVAYPNPYFKINANDRLKFEVVYKNYIYINNARILFVKTRAKTFYRQGHQFGYTETYYLDSANKVQPIHMVTKAEEPHPIGDFDVTEIVKIGNAKSGIISTFSSTGNHHMERNMSISLLTISGLKWIGDIDLDYSNEAWIDKDDIQNIENCLIESYQSDYCIEDTQSEWFKIIVTKNTKSFSQRCLDEQVKSEQIVFLFDGTKYSRLTK